MSQIELDDIRDTVLNYFQKPEVLRRVYDLAIIIIGIYVLNTVVVDGFDIPNDLYFVVVIFIIVLLITPPKKMQREIDYFSSF